MTSQQPVEKSKVNTQEINVESLALLSIFVQVGQYSGHPYQPPGNHRPLVHSTFHNFTLKKDGTQTPPLIRSLVQPSQEYNFSTSDTMSVHAYEIAEGAGSENDVLLKSQSPMTLSFPDKENFQGYGTIDNCHVVSISNNGFREMLSFFGLSWWRKDEGGNEHAVDDDENVTLDDVRCFLALIGKHNISTPASFKHFLQEFDMGRLFKYDDQLPLETNTRFFFALYAANTRVRLLYFDGKHRGLISAYFATGFYDACCVIDHKFCPFKSFEELTSFAGLSRDGLKREEFQCFTKQTICVGVPKTSGTLRAQLKALENFGCDRTLAAEVNVSDSLKTFWGEYMSWLVDNDKLDELKPLDFDNMWNDDKLLNSLDHNLDAIYENLMTWVEENNKIKLVNGILDWNKTKVELGKKW